MGIGGGGGPPSRRHSADALIETWCPCTSWSIASGNSSCAAAWQAAWLAKLVVVSATDTEPVSESASTIANRFHIVTSASAARNRGLSVSGPNLLVVFGCAGSAPGCSPTSRVTVSTVPRTQCGKRELRRTRRNQRRIALYSGKTEFHFRSMTAFSQKHG